MKPGFHSLEISHVTWEIPERYSQLHPIGFGAYGSVCSAIDAKLGRKVAIKKLSKPFQTEIHAKRTYRELQMLKHMNHENIICLIDVFTPAENFTEFSDVYLVTPQMGADLNNIIKSQSLTDDHVQFLIYQILRGLKYLHSANICHRDLKPSNIAVNEDCELKILDFGLARQKDNEMTGYVATRWYRAPEIMLNWMHYTDNVDVWSVGCIMGELLTGKPLFPGSDHVDQLMRIMGVTGKPKDEFMQKITSEEAKSFINQLRPMAARPLNEIFIGASEQALSLLQRMLVLDPDHRITAVEALQHPYLAQYHDPSDEPDAETYEDPYEAEDFPVDEWRRLVWTNMINFTPKLESLEG